MFTWICQKCGREVPPAYDECPDCAAKAAGGATPLGAVAPPQQSQAAAPPSVGSRGGRRPLWATGTQEAMPAAPPPSFASSQEPSSPAAAAPPEAPPTVGPSHAMSPMFQPAPQAPQYAPPPPPRHSPLLTGIAVAVIVIMTAGGIYWFFLRSQQMAADATPTTAAPIAAPTAAGENPVNRFVEVSGVRFSPMTKGIQAAFVLINHSDQDLVGLTGTATILAKTNKGDEETVGVIKFQTSMAAQSSKELQLPLETTKKMVDMPDWQTVSVKVQITSPSGA